MFVGGNLSTGRHAVNDSDTLASDADCVYCLLMTDTPLLHIQVNSDNVVIMSEQERPDPEQWNQALKMVGVKPGLSPDWDYAVEDGVHIWTLYV